MLLMTETKLELLFSKKSFTLSLGGLMLKMNEFYDDSCVLETPVPVLHREVFFIIRINYSRIR